MQYSRAFLPHPVLSRVFERLKDCTDFDTRGGLGHVHKLARCPAGWHRRTAQPLPSLRSVGRLQCGEQLEARLAASVRSSYQRLNDDGHSIRAVADEALTLAVTINALAHDAHELAPEARNVKCRRARTERQARRGARCGRCPPSAASVASAPHCTPVISAAPASLLLELTATTAYESEPPAGSPAIVEPSPLATRRTAISKC